MKRLFHGALFGAALVGAAVGAFGIASALSADSHEKGADQGRVDVTLSPGPFAATTGSEAATFEYSFSELKDVPGVKVASADNKGICLNIEFQGGASEGTCTDAETLTTGLGYAAFGQEGGSFFVVGLVPDEVDTVTVGGQPASLDGNVWTFTITAGKTVDLRVGNSSANKWATLAG